MAQPMDPQQDDPPVRFEDFYRCEYRLLMKVVMAIGGTLDEAHDAVNETMTEMMRRWPQIRNARAYARVAVVTNFIKQKERERKGPARAVEGGYLIPEAHECTELTAWEDKQWVDQLIYSLPRAQREVAEAILLGLTVEQTSKLLGPTPATIRQHLRRATRRLIQLRKERGHEGYGGEIR